MKLKGFDKFREKVPVLAGKRIVIILIEFLLFLLVGLSLQFLFDTLSVILYDYNVSHFLLVFMPIIGLALTLIIALVFVYQLWYWRDRLKAKYGPLSYQRVLFVGLAGVTMIISILIHSYIPFYNYDLDFWSQYPFSIFITPLTLYIPTPFQIFSYLRLIFGILFCFLGILMAVNSILTFGFDYMTLVYLYFPEESELQDHEIYSVLRHPAYAGILYMCLGSAILYFTIYAISFWFILFIGMSFHVKYVEEKELIKRFGKSYKDYKSNVHAFFVSPKNWIKFLKIIIRKK